MQRRERGQRRQQSPVNTAKTPEENLQDRHRPPELHATVSHSHKHLRLKGGTSLSHRHQHWGNKHSNWSRENLNSSM